MEAGPFLGVSGGIKEQCPMLYGKEPHRVISELILDVLEPPFGSFQGFKVVWLRIFDKRTYWLLLWLWGVNQLNLSLNKT